MAAPAKAPWGGHAKKRADRIRAEVSIFRVLASYGFRVDPDAPDHEQQFSCSLHGDGTDGKPSARAYPDSNSYYCFACGRTRDPIAVVREKEGMDFWAAVKALEARYNLPRLPWEQDADAAEDEARVREVREALAGSLDTRRTFEEERLRVERTLTSATNERELSLHTLTAYWEVLDRIAHGVTGPEKWPEARGKEALTALRARIIARLQAVAEGSA